jgi:S-adenosylmethionine:tRNA ribosyltransferase-isomerase
MKREGEGETGELSMKISDFDYELPEGRIAKFPLEARDASKLLVWRSEPQSRNPNAVVHDRGIAEYKQSIEYPEISETTFGNIGSVLPSGSLLVFNNTRVVRARLVMHKPVAETGAGVAGAATAAAGTAPAGATPTGATAIGARIEILCLEPTDPADYDRAFAARDRSEWNCMVGNLKKWKSGPLEIPFTYSGAEHLLRAWRSDGGTGGEQRVRFEWDADLTFGQLLEFLGRVPIPPYLGRDSESIDNTRYQTVYARTEGSVAAPTAGLHFTPELISGLGSAGIATAEVTLHVGAGTFLPVKADNALDHPMHTEHFEVTLRAIERLLEKRGHVIAVGTTSVRTLESLPALAWRIRRTGDADVDTPVRQFEPYDIPEDFDGRTALETLASWMRSHGLDSLKGSTRIMITPAGFTFRIVDGIVTNFHQPRSTLLLLIAAFTRGMGWRRIYDYALNHNFRFLSYGDSSLLLRNSG